MIAQIFLLIALISNVQSFPRMEERNLNSTNNLGSLGTTESNATAHGLGSTVGISGIVSGDTSSTSSLALGSSDNQNSAMSSQGNCSEFSTSSAQGSTGADATASGDCLLNLDNSGVLQPGRGIAIGIEGSSSTSNQTTNSPSSSMINQTVTQNYQEGSVEVYQMVHGPQPTSSFSGPGVNGVMAPTAQGEQILAGTSETTISHVISTGATTVEHVITPFVTPPNISLMTDQLPRVDK